MYTMYSNIITIWKTKKMTREMNKSLTIPIPKNVTKKNAPTTVQCMAYVQCLYGVCTVYVQYTLYVVHSS